MVAASVHRDGSHEQIAIGAVQHAIEIGPEARARRIAPEHAVVDDPCLLVAAPADDLHFDPVPLHIDARRQHGHAGGEVAAPILAPRHQRIGGDGIARLVLPGFAQLGVDPDLQAGGIRCDAGVLLRDLGPCLPRGIER